MRDRPLGRGICRCGLAWSYHDGTLAQPEEYEPRYQCNVPEHAARVAAPSITDDPDYYPSTEYERGYADGRVAAPSDGLQEALARYRTALAATPTRCQWCPGGPFGGHARDCAAATPTEDPGEPTDAEKRAWRAGAEFAMPVAAPSDGLRAKAETLECIRQHFGATRRCDEYDDGRELCAPCYVRTALAATPTDD
jgi:hypothetical protein